MNQCPKCDTTMYIVTHTSLQTYYHCPRCLYEIPLDYYRDIVCPNQNCQNILQYTLLNASYPYYCDKCNYHGTGEEIIKCPKCDFDIFDKESHYYHEPNLLNNNLPERFVRCPSCNHQFQEITENSSCSIL